MESKNVLIPPFFVSMATAAKFVQPIPIFLAYLAPLDVDVVPIKFHQFLLLPLFNITMPNVTAGGIFFPGGHCNLLASLKHL
jgi:hypothetical protein